jgi:hypothetical protein
MAYPTVDKPYGLKPINLIGGQVFAGATRHRSKLPAAYATGNLLWRSGQTEQLDGTD